MTPGDGRPVVRPKEIGWREFVGLPDLEIDRIKAKIDTGARTSALHALDQRPFESDGAPWIGFSIPSPTHGQPIHCTAPVVDRRAIKNTSGIPETRPIIMTTLVIGRRRWHIEVSLSDRSEMEFDLILGRAAIRGHGLVVNPGKSFLAGPPVERVAAMPRKPATRTTATFARPVPSAPHALPKGDEK